MPYAKSGDFNIYYEVEGEGEPVTFQHGLTNSLEDWRDFGFIDALKDDNQLILIDALGHGKSDKPHDSKYYGSNSARDIIAVLDDLDINTTHYFGYSMGGNIGLRLAFSYPERMKSIIVGGVGPLTAPPSSVPMAFQQLTQALEGGAETFISFVESSSELSPVRKARLMANDFEALLSCFKSISSPVPDMVNELSQMTIPLLVFVGESDQFFPHEQLREGYKNVPDLTFLILPNLDHMQAEQRSDLIVPHVKEFLARVENKGA
jgi:pimeloyl-ACP methyl ester carboxylesterase